MTTVNLDVANEYLSGNYRLTLVKLQNELWKNALSMFSRIIRIILIATGLCLVNAGLGMGVFAVLLMYELVSLVVQVKRIHSSWRCYRHLVSVYAKFEKNDVNGSG